MTPVIFYVAIAFTVCSVGAMPVTITTKQKVALLAAYPGHFLSTGSLQLPSDLESVTEQTSQSGIQDTLRNLRSKSLETRDLLSQAVNNTVLNEWGCTTHVLRYLRPKVQYRWTWNNTTGMAAQETEQLQTLIRLAGYVIFLDTSLKLPNADAIFGRTTTTLGNIKNEIAMAASPLRSLLMTFSDIAIYSKAKESHAPNGQGFMENVRPTDQPIMVRCLTGLALEDMHQTFSLLKVTDSALHLDG